jgi:hypothetical protein
VLNYGVRYDLSFTVVSLPFRVWGTRCATSGQKHSVRSTLSRVVSSDHSPIGIPRKVRVHPDPSGRIFEMFDRKLEEVELEDVEWLLNYARNASKPIPVASAITMKKVNAPRRPRPMKLLHPPAHHRGNKLAHLPNINPDAASSLLPVRFACQPGQ